MKNMLINNLLVCYYVFNILLVCYYVFRMIFCLLLQLGVADAGVVDGL